MSNEWGILRRGLVWLKNVVKMPGQLMHSCLEHGLTESTGGLVDDMATSHHSCDILGVLGSSVNVTFSLFLS